MKTLRQMEIEDDLRSRHGGMLSSADVGRELGLQNKEAIRAFLAGLPAYEIGSRRRWRVCDLAKRLADTEVRA